MIDFMVIGLPRSATTWASNWLTTDLVHCYHDPLYHTHYENWDGLSIPGTLTGVSCTGIWRWPGWVNRHPSKKLILHRDLGEINQSLVDIGLDPLPHGSEEFLGQIQGLHIPFEDLFSSGKACQVWEYLVGSPFNSRRHGEISPIEMQPQFSKLTVGEEVTRKLREELAAIW